MGVAIDPVYENEFALMKREAEKKQVLKENELIEDFRWVMSDPRGRRFLWRLLDMTRLFGETFTGASSTYYNLGRQDIGKWVYAKAREAGLKLWRKAEDENIEREKNNVR